MSQASKIRTVVLNSLLSKSVENKELIWNDKSYEGIQYKTLHELLTKKGFTPGAIASALRNITKHEKNIHKINYKGAVFFIYEPHTSLKPKTSIVESEEFNNIKFMIKNIDFYLTTILKKTSRNDFIEINKKDNFYIRLMLETAQEFNLLLKDYENESYLSNLEQFVQNTED